MLLLYNLFPYFAIIWLLLVLLEVFFNLYTIEIKHERPNYLSAFFRRAFAALATAFILAPEPHTSEVWMIFIFQATTFWVSFSPLLNKLRGKPFWYLGEESGWIDRFFIKHPTFYKVVYFMIMIIAIISGIQLYEFNTV